MAILTIVLGLLLIMLGVGGYVTADPPSVTALIPAFFGVVFLVLGGLSLKRSSRKFAAPASLVLALLGLFSTAAMGWPKLPALLTGKELDRPAAVASQSIMAALCLLFIVAVIVLFVRGRGGKSKAKA